MMNTVDNVLGPVKTGTTQTLMPFSRVVFEPRTLPCAIAVRKRSRMLLVFGLCGRAAMNLPGQIWKSFLQGCELTASINAKFP